MAIFSKSWIPTQSHKTQKIKVAAQIRVENRCTEIGPIGMENITDMNKEFFKMQ